MHKVILQVEDEDHDVMFMQLALEKSGVKNKVIVVRDGREAIAFLEGRDRFADRKEYPLPGLVLLDLKLPFTPGLLVLKRLRELPAFRDARVLIFSSSSQDSDVEAAYALGADGYVVKPAYPELVPVVKSIKKHWIDSNRPPPNAADWQSIVVPRPHSSQSEKR